MQLWTQTILQEHCIEPISYRSPSCLEEDPVCVHLCGCVHVLCLISFFFIALFLSHKLLKIISSFAVEN